MAAFGVPPSFFTSSAPRAPQQLPAKEIANRLLLQHTPQVIIQKYTEAKTSDRNLDVLYILLRQWLSANNHQLIRQLADGFLLSHFSDGLLLAGGWENNRECLAILWKEGVQFKGNWKGATDQVVEFLEPYMEPEKIAPLVETLEQLSVNNTD